MHNKNNLNPCALDPLDPMHATSSKDLISENKILRERLEDLLDQAHRNQQIMRRHQEFDLQIIGANSFNELIDNLFSSLTETSELDIVTLCLLDPENSIRHIFLNQHGNLSKFPNLFFFKTKEELGPLHDSLHQPILGQYSHSQHCFMFPQRMLEPASVAIIPLLRHNKLIGCLNLGSLERSRFSVNLATDFIERLGSIIAVCLENGINNERLKQISLTDPLTGISNRRYIEQRLHEEISRARRQHYSISCLYIDIDHFKKINDRVGHQGGDIVLCEVARRIRAELRLSDALARFGGEEFVVLLIDAELTNAIKVAERIRASIAHQLFKLSLKQNINATVSIGVATLTNIDRPETIEATAQRIIAQADHALYAAKENGRNKVICLG